MHGGGGSAGSLWVECRHFVGKGRIRAMGGDGNNNGGGGAGGRISVFYTTGNFHSDGTDARGGQRGSQNAENGGPGVVYLQGTSPSIRNLRIDNKGRPPEVHISSVCHLLVTIVYFIQGIH